MTETTFTWLLIGISASIAFSMLFAIAFGKAAAQGDALMGLTPEKQWENRVGRHKRFPGRHKRFPGRHKADS